MMGQSGGLPGVQRLIEGVQHEVGAQVSGYSPADYAPCERVDDESCVNESASGADVRQIRNPQGVRLLGTEVTVHQVQWAISSLVKNRGDLLAAPGHALQASSSHEPLYSAARHELAFPVQFLPHLPRAVTLFASIPHPLDFHAQVSVMVKPEWLAALVPLTGLKLVINARGDRQLPADRLDPILTTVLIDERGHHFRWRSSSAWAKNAGRLFLVSPVPHAKPGLPAGACATQLAPQNPDCQSCQFLWHHRVQRSEE